MILAKEVCTHALAHKEPATPVWLVRFQVDSFLSFKEKINSLHWIRNTRAKHWDEIKGLMSCMTNDLHTCVGVVNWTILGQPDHSIYGDTDCAIS